MTQVSTDGGFDQFVALKGLSLKYLDKIRKHMGCSGYSQETRYLDDVVNYIKEKDPNAIIEINSQEDLEKIPSILKKHIEMDA